MSETARPASGEAARDFDAWRRKNIARLDLALGKILTAISHKQPRAVERLVSAMGYAVLGGGKRLRPLLALSAAEAVGAPAKAALPAALAVEMIHAYSLVHDDLPCMDDDDLRRGQPTCHKAFGEADALLAGDALQTLAFETLAISGRKNPEAAHRALTAISLLARAAGALGMVGGQALDLALENRDDGSPVSEAPAKASPELVRDMERRKTGELMTAALACGAVLGGGTSQDVEKFRHLGLTLGLSFQIRDDLLNLSGDPALLGKAVGSDARRGKASFPAVLGPEAAELECRRLTARALAQATAWGAQGRHLVQLIESLTGRVS